MPASSRETRAAVIDEEHFPASPLLALALEHGGLWLSLDRTCRNTGINPEDLQIVVKPDIGAFAAGSPTATDPQLVEDLIDRLHDRGFRRVDVVASSDSSWFWAENRDVLAVAELLGYQFTTARGIDYQIRDLSDDLAESDFPQGSALHGSSISRAWKDADFRIIFAKNKTDELEGYALTIDSLIGIPPFKDRDYFYRYRFGSGIVASEILNYAPPHFALVDALRSSHGSGGQRSPVSIDTGTLVASESAVLADFAAALKMGIDPYISRVNAHVLRHHGLPSQYRIEGNLSSYKNWKPVHPVITDSVRKRSCWMELNRTLQPWLQQLDHEKFPLKDPIDARANEVLAKKFVELDDEPGYFALYALANYGLSWIYESVRNYQTLFSKDAIDRRNVPLGVQLSEFGDDDYEAPLRELSQLTRLLRDQPFKADRLRWRYLEQAVLFEISKVYPVTFEEFVTLIDVSKTIQFMNDYVGGTIVVVSRDAEGRPKHQAERNIYLPQPNYLTLTGGTVIDVTKMEYVQYSKAQHRMCWKTIKSENGSAQFDDGIVAFTRLPKGTRVSISGRQLFALPAIWKLINLDLVPTLKAELVTHAYSTFFQRTFSNFEALLEGRDIRIGRAWHMPQNADDSRPLLRETLGNRVLRLLEEHGPLISEFLALTGERSPLRVDGDGFRHFCAPARDGDEKGEKKKSSTRLQDLVARSLSGFWAELAEAASRDAQWKSEQATMR